jgi:hypothetical protein
MHVFFIPALPNFHTCGLVSLAAMLQAAALDHSSGAVSAIEIRGNQSHPNTQARDSHTIERVITITNATITSVTFPRER